MFSSSANSNLKNWTHPFAVRFYLIGLVVPWKEFVNFCVYLILFLITFVLFFFFNLLLKRTGLSNTQKSLHVQTYYKEKQNLRFLIRLVIHNISTYLFKMMN